MELSDDIAEFCSQLILIITANIISENIAVRQKRKITDYWLYIAVYQNNLFKPYEFVILLDILASHLDILSS